MNSANPAKKSQLIIIFVTIFIYLAGFGIIIPILPNLARDLGASSLQVGLLMSVYSAMQFLFAPFWGRISDRIGRRPILLFCMLGEGLAYILFAWARNLEMLFAARILAGFFAASISTASAYISDITPREQRSRGMAIIGVAFGLGFLIGPAIGGGLAYAASFISAEPFYATSFASYFVALMCVLNFFSGLRFLKESLNKSSEPQRKEGRLKQLIRYLRQPLLGSLIGVFFLSSIAMSIMEATLILFVGDKFQWGVREVSFGFAYIGLISVLSQGLLVRRLLPIMGERKMLAIGLSLMAISLLGTAFSPNIWILAVMQTGLALGHSFTNPSILGSISLVGNAKEQGAVMGTTQSSASLGRILGPAFGGFIYQRLAISAPFIVGGLIAICGFLVVLSKYAQLPESAKGGDKV